MQKPITVVQIGLGPIGLQITRHLRDNGAFRIAGAVDVDPEKVGQDLGTLAGLEPLGLLVTGRLSDLDLEEVRVAVLTTVSSLSRATSQILEAIEAGLHVVSTCEELAYPWKTHPQLAQRIDQEARRQGVGVLGTGINPGFLMDFLVLVSSAVCLEVRRVKVERIQNAASRRLPFQEKIGVGLTPRQFKERMALGDLRHVGLTESMHMIAQQLGWKLDLTEDRIEPLLAREKVSIGDLTVPPGHALGLLQTGHGFIKEEEVVSLIFRATIGEPESYDMIDLDADPPVQMRLHGGINGDIGTGAITINAIPSLLESQPGLRTMADLLPVSCFNASRRSWKEAQS